jgi:hypothetical protein
MDPKKWAHTLEIDLGLSHFALQTRFVSRTCRRGLEGSLEIPQCILILFDSAVDSSTRTKAKRKKSIAHTTDEIKALYALKCEG